VLLIDAQPYVGHHCESTSLVNLLRQREIDLSEPLVFGLGSGLSFTYWRTQQMPAPFLGGRIKPDRLTANITASLGLRLTVRETSSDKRAREQLLQELDSGTVVGLKLDRHHLDYSTDEYRFAAHYVACVGYEDDRFALVETRPLGLGNGPRWQDSSARREPPRTEPPSSTPRNWCMNSRRRSTA
jgi:hypothetical protein